MPCVGSESRPRPRAGRASGTGRNGRQAFLERRDHRGDGCRRGRRRASGVAACTACARADALACLGGEAGRRNPRRVESSARRAEGRTCGPARRVPRLSSRQGIWRPPILRCRCRSSPTHRKPNLLGLKQGRLSKLRHSRCHRLPTSRHCRRLRRPSLRRPFRCDRPCRSNSRPCSRSAWPTYDENCPPVRLLPRNASADHLCSRNAAPRRRQNASGTPSALRSIRSANSSPGGDKSAVSRLKRGLGRLRPLP